MLCIEFLYAWNIYSRKVFTHIGIHTIRNSLAVSIVSCIMLF